MIKTVLFDLDGTLLDTEPDFTWVLNQLLRQHGRPPVTRQQVRQTVSSGSRALITLGVGLQEGEAGFNERLAELLDLYDEQILQTRCGLFADVENLLKRISESGLRWGVVTNKPSRFTTPLLARVAELSDCPVVVCSDHVTVSKPDPEGLLLACQKAGCRPDEAIYVGDHPRDIEAGRKAGMPTVAAAWGYLPEGAAVEDWQADFIAQDIADIEHFLFSKQ